MVNAPKMALGKRNNTSSLPFPSARPIFTTANMSAFISIGCSALAVMSPFS
jgi:hypothetical protein